MQQNTNTEEEYKKEAREQFKQDALNAWEKYQQDGLHLTFEEVDEWLRNLGTDKETPLPPCHT